MSIIEAIDKKIGEVRTESLDLSVGEVVSLHDNRELVIQPDFQRLFRWSSEQQSRLIESLLLELPIPSIFLIERENGVLELIDGLQRVSSIIHFISAKALGLEELSLEGCDLIDDLNGQTFKSLPLTLQLRLKRTSIRTVVIKRQSSQFLRYEMFKRLNTGGSKLSEQDVRNVNARMIGEPGTKFYDFLIRCSQHSSFVMTTDLLSASAIDSRAREELVLRFFALKNYRDKFKGSISDWLDNYLEEILLKDAPFNMATEWVSFEQLFNVLAEKFGSYAFVKYRNGNPLGGVAPAYFEAVTGGALSSLSSLQKMTSQDATKRLADTVSSDEFRDVTGPGANSLPKLQRRIELIAAVFQ